MKKVLSIAVIAALSFVGCKKHTETEKPTTQTASEVVASEPQK